MRPVRIAPALLVAAAMMLSACGGHKSASHARAASPSRTTPAPAAPGPPADPADVRVIRGWVDALRQGKIEKATRYFAVPALVQNGGSTTFRLKTRAEVRFFNLTLPCGAVLVRTFLAGRYTVAIFRLVNRVGPGAGSGCDAPGGTAAATAFAIRGRRITRWLRVPVPPGSDVRPGATGPAV